MSMMFLFAGCVSVHTRSAPGVNLQAFRTFSFYQRSPDQVKQIAFERSLAGQTIRNQVTQDLTQRGMIEVPPGQPADMMVAYHANVRQQFQYADWGYGPGWGWGWGGWGAPMVTSYTEGTIIVDFLDPRTHTVIWRGTASSTVSNPDNPDPNKIAGAVNKMMDRLPAQMASAAPRTPM